MTDSSMPSADDLRIIRDGDTIEKLVIIKKFMQIRSATVIHPLLEVLGQGIEELIPAVGDALVELRDIIFPTLQTEITNPNGFIRWGIALAIQKLDDPSFVEYIIPAIGLGYEPTLDIITKTLHQLAPHRFPESYLTSILKRLNYQEKRKVAIYAVKQLGPQALDSAESLLALRIMADMAWDGTTVPLLKAGHHMDIRVRQQALHYLAEIPANNIANESLRMLNQLNEHLENPLDFILSHTENYPLHYYAIEGLGYINNPKTRKILLKILHDGSSVEKIFAITALERFTRNGTQSPTFYSEIQEELQSLLHISERGSRKKLIQALGKIKEEWARSAILLHIHDPDPELRFAVAQALLQATDSEILPKVAILLGDELRTVRHAIVSLFWKLDPGKYFGLNEGDIILKLEEPLRNELIAKLHNSVNVGSPESREFATFWLGIFRYTPAFNDLVANLQHPEESVVLTTVVALGMFGNKEALKQLVPLINHTNPRIQKKTIESIGSLGLDGLYTLIHELYQYGPTNPTFLESFIETFGGRVIGYLTQEIDAETNRERKNRLIQFYNHVSQKYQVHGKDDFGVLL